jgi:starvation-inducible DNA-binding protein
MMKTLDYLHLDASKATKVIAGLQQLLANYQVYYTNLRGFHWNIKGHGFFVLHSKFEELYDDAADKVDEIAERILMLGGEPVSAFSEYLKTSRVKEISGVSCGNEALKNILDTYSLLIEEERALLSIASDAKDEATVALMSDYLKGQEKTVWMLVAFSSGDCKK